MQRKTEEFSRAIFNSNTKKIKSFNYGLPLILYSPVTNHYYLYRKTLNLQVYDNRPRKSVTGKGNDGSTFTFRIMSAIAVESVERGMKRLRGDIYLWHYHEFTHLSRKSFSFIFSIITIAKMRRFYLIQMGTISHWTFFFCCGCSTLRLVRCGAVEKLWMENFSWWRRRQR